MRFSFQQMLVGFGISALLVSCEGHTARDWRLDNNSSTKIYFQADKIFPEDALSETLGMGSGIIVAQTEQRGGNSSVQMPSEVFSNLIITNSDGDTMKTDVMTDSSWETVIKQTKKSPSHYEHSYTLIIEDNDF